MQTKRDPQVELMRLRGVAGLPATNRLARAASLAWLAVAWAIPGQAAEAPAGQTDLAVTYLRCESLVDPLGIGVATPRLSWQLEATARGQRQTAYQVLVAGRPTDLEQRRGLLWDSGKVTSAETTVIVYQGAPLGSHQRCYWKVRAWDKADVPSAWSKPARWSVGLLSPSDWQADWIGYDKLRPASSADAPFEGAKWIWFAADPAPNPPKGTRVFMATLRLPPDAKVQKAELIVTADDRYWCNLNGQMVASSEPVPEVWRRPKLINVAERLKPGENTVRVQVENGAESPAGLLAKLTVTTLSGETLTLATDATWRATDQPGANWHSRPIGPLEWPACRVVGDYGALPWGKLKLEQNSSPGAAYLRTTFNTARRPVRATLYATGLGWFDVHVNGQRVSEDRFNPGWTDYNKRVYYRAYDVSGLVRRGRNAFGAVLATGWYSGCIGWEAKREHYGQKPRFRGQLVLEYGDGTKEIYGTNPRWKAADGPVREADILMGETYDARLGQTGWDRAGFDDAKWAAVDTGAELQPKVEAHPGPPVRVVAEFKPARVTQPTPGAYVLDLGQNFAGIARLNVVGEPGQKITLRFAERLNPDGTVYTVNLRTARATDTYICRGQGLETWEPRFTFHGFQYLEVTGLKQPPGPDTIVGLALSSDTPVAGEFVCSDPMLNRLRQNIYWTQRANFLDIPTDCPQRDERLGWTGDAQVYVRTATLNADVQPFFTKWLVDLEDGQRADGQFPMIAPVKVAGDDGGPAWADAGVICPWTIYEVYGDRRVLERHYDSMTRFLAFCRNRATRELLPPAQYHCFGDWLSIQADTPKDIIYTAYFAYCTRLTAQAAEALGKTADAAKYRAWFEEIKAAFNRAYVGTDGRIRGDTQTCYVLALAFDLLDEAKRQAAAEHLVDNIARRGWHLSTGFIGTKDLMLALAKIGRNDVAYRLIHNETFPSWGFSIKHGATSIWERWDGWTPENGFQDPGMNSFAHYSFGAVYQWMVENIGGIRSQGPAYQKIVIAPQLDGRLTAARTVYRSVQGRIESDWRLLAGKFFLDVVIPPNTTATVHVPAADPGDVTEGGQDLNGARGVRLVGFENRRAVLAVESGRYQFISRSPVTVP